MLRALSRYCEGILASCKQERLFWFQFHVALTVACASAGVNPIQMCSIGRFRLTSHQPDHCLMLPEKVRCLFFLFGSSQSNFL